MATLQTKYMGLSLRNPLILGASNMVNNLDNLKRAEDAGIAAVVYRSLFEEQMQLESYQLDDQLEAYNERNAEMVTLFPNIEHGGPKEHLFNLQKVKEALSVPVIASINAIYKETWVDYAKQIAQTGVDALELNFFSVPRDLTKDGKEIISSQIEALKAVKAAVKIPVSVKVSPFYTNVLKTIKAYEEAGADAVVLFNRLFEPDIDIEAEKHTSPWNLSTPHDHRLAIRYTGMLYGNINSSIAGANGIYDGKDMVKLLLAGADAVQAVSTFYHNGIRHITKMLDEAGEWMDRKGYKTVDDFKGKLSQKAINDPFVYKRAQYIDLLLKSDEIFTKVL